MNQTAGGLGVEGEDESPVPSKMKREKISCFNFFKNLREKPARKIKNKKKKTCNNSGGGVGSIRKMCVRHFCLKREGEK